MKVTDQIFCGLEGGASFSKLVLVKGNGEVLCWVDGPCTNHLLVGKDECQNRISTMIEKAKKEAGIDPKIPLGGLGLSMSGCEREEENRKFEDEFLIRFPNLTRSVSVSSDTVGSVLTASPKGGMVLIAGTGSNALVINPDGTTARCGGWGHLIGDEASAFWISRKAIKIIFDAEDNFDVAPHDITRAKETVLKHFKVQDKSELLSHCYVNFSKSFFAGVCVKLAQVAEEGDPLCRFLFYEAGNALAKHVMALIPKIHHNLLESEGGLPIVCVGSVFKSWELLKDGFHGALDSKLHEFSLLRLKTSSAIGAAFMGAKAVGVKLPLNFSENFYKLHHFKC
ncbi:N-acetyl-D-glucosamine kinase-like [Limulus polyphemus]|uniref:N-acetyl-D-glucosamine kinase n=1 Tax=Limulus polyphemus TaxID=6850 RepID=A0ABM1BF46_LIMPO|nr:N-acetyl-D-glucosamine kinase-like [Limulus polyphemus]